MLFKNVLFTKVGAGIKETNKESYGMPETNSSMQLPPAAVLKESKGIVLIIQRRGAIAVKESWLRGDVLF